MIALQLLAQLVAPPLQPGPVRLPGSGIVQPPLAPGQQLQPIPQLQLPSEEVVPSLPREPQPEPPHGSQPAEPGPQVLPRVEGLDRYSTDELRRILAPCAAIADPAQRLSACAAALTTRLVLDGYVNSRVYPLATPFPGVLEVVEGRIVEITITSTSPRLTRRLQRVLLPLQGTVLHLPSLELTIQRLQQLSGVGQLDAKLNRLGGDSTRAVLEVNAEAAAEQLQGEVALRNDGNGGSGQFRGLATLLKNNLALGGDTLLVFGELDTDSNPSLGYTIGSISYSLPLGDRLAFTTAFGFSRRNLVEASPPFDQLSFRQLQLLGQLEVTLWETLSSRWSAFAGLSVSRSDAYLAGASFPAIAGGGSEGWLRTGFLRAGINAEGSGPGFAWSGGVYGLQGISGLSTTAQLNSLASFGIQPGEARSIGGQLNAAWALAPRWQLQLGAAGQLAFQPLTGPMGFALGSDNGLRGLPGQVISGDSGLLGRAELSWSIWSQGQSLLQLVPFIGAGAIRTETPDGTLTDSAGAGGLLLRWLNRSGWLVELGWTNQFGTEQRPFLGDWLLGSGIYTKLSYRF
ncbi:MULTISPECIES: ShlB/FhaC/HecB family hemolysin secretion/activation protein [Synechococcales]|uniref:ShlB/FhaC/HecB family hemolysin secretion/activation protein n=1 Tax=unclassified Synechococcus TaxID=2626047 RepID=UPI0021A27D89|nr:MULTISPECIES: ShlB/FhaC/HecB family hemolysin secretion/activation protein [unclassified Synechococcus]